MRVRQLKALTWARLLGLAAVLLTGCGRRNVEVSMSEADAVEGSPAAPEGDQPERQAAQGGRDVGGGFRFPGDRGGTLLADVLRPLAKLPPEDSSPRSSAPGVPTSRLLDLTDLPLPPLDGALPRFARPVRAPEFGPPPPGEDGYPRGVTREVAGLEFPSLPDAKGTRVWAPPLNEPTRLPLLGLGQPEAMPAEDPTAASSLAAALAAPLPTRTSPVPFLRLNVPDPYEFRRRAGPQEGKESERLPPSVLLAPIMRR
jgi:hypothetical protein